MRQTLSRTKHLNTLKIREVLFTLDEARRALPYVDRIVQDAADAYRTIQQCRIALDECHDPSLRGELDVRRDQALRRLNAAIDDCNHVGVDLIDIPRGVVRFNAIVENRNIALVWRMGDPIAQAWSDVISEPTYAAAR